MEINKVNMPPVNPYKANEVKVKKTSSQTPMQSDKLEISSEAKKLSEIQSYEVDRNERLSELKAEIKAGTYKVDPEALAVDLLGYYNK